MESNLSSAPPQMGDMVYSWSSRMREGVGKNYADAYNEMMMAKYNNDYNYWLWQQQMKYNSPAAQRERLEAAGLNPNYQSIEGGNMSSIPVSSGHISPSIGRNINASTANTINTINAILAAMKTGIDAVSNISGIPHDIKTYRRLLTMNRAQDLDNKQLDYMLKTIDRVWQMKSKLGISYDGMFPTGVYENGAEILATPDWEASPEYQRLIGTVENLNLKNEDLEWLIKLKEYDLENIKPAEKSVLESRAWLIGEQAGLTRKQNKWFVARVLTEMGSKAAPSLIRMAKLL